MLNLSDDAIIQALADWLKPKLACSLYVYPNQIQLYAPRTTVLKHQYWVAIHIANGVLYCNTMGDIPIWSCDLADPNLFDFIDSELRTVFYAKN